MLLAHRDGMLASPPRYWGLCFTAEEPNVVVNMAKANSPPAVTLEASTDGVVWTTFDVDGGTTPIILAAVGDHVFFRAGTDGNAKFASGPNTFHYFILSGKCSASGNCMSLISASDPTVDFTSANTFAFIGLFYSCTSLTAAPELPATTMINFCYYRMFRGCTSLTAAPELPATTLAVSCYNQMFYDCTSLTAAPELPVATMANACYNGMFRGCASLASITVKFSAFPTGTATWMDGVAATGVFRCPTALGTNETIQRGVSYCPEGWTVVNTD